ncbi:hypothetical protein [Luteimonas changyuni]|uniref:hypothetical protein n=1 Tax=Luteimonas sp. MJ145 TaxID=3129234 RepID=UPI0031BA43E3
MFKPVQQTGNSMHFARSASIAALLLASNLAMAGEYSERLSACLVASVTAEDKTALVRWIFGAVASHPEVADISGLTPGSWDEISRRSAAVFEKLIADKCASESRDAILNEGMAGYKSAFETLGATAVGGLMTDPAVTKAMADLDSHLSEEKMMKALMTGIPQGE